MEDTLEIRLACDTCEGEECCYISDIGGWIEWTCQKCGQVSYEPNDE